MEEARGARQKRSTREGLNGQFASFSLLLSKPILKISKLTEFFHFTGRSGHLVSLEHEDIEVDDEKDLDVNLSGQESSASDVEQIESDDLFVGERPVKKRSLPRPRRGSKRAKKEKKPQLEEGDETPDDEEDGEYVGDEEVVLREKSRSKSKALAKVSTAFLILNWEFANN